MSLSLSLAVVIFHAMRMAAEKPGIEAKFPSDDGGETISCRNTNQLSNDENLHVPHCGSADFSYSVWWINWQFALYSS